jgi:hypothetical protein
MANPKKNNQLREGFYEGFVILAHVLIVPLEAFLLMHEHDSLNLHELLINPTNTIFNTINPDRTPEQDPFFVLASSAVTMSALSYVGRAIDYANAGVIDEQEPIHSEVRDNNQEYLDRELNKNKYRNCFVVVALLAGLASGIAFAVIFLVSGGFGIAMWLTALMAIFSMMSALAGLGSRFGQVIDRWRMGTDMADNDFYTQENSVGWGLLHVNRNYELAIILSLALSVLPVAFLILNASTGNIFEILTLVATAIVLASSLNSGAHYTGRTLDFLFGEVTLFSPLLWLFNTVNNKDSLRYSVPFYERLFNKDVFWDNCNNENLATFVGFAAAITISALMLTAVIGVWMPPFLLALPLALKAPLLTMALMSACCSVPARVGRWLDCRWKTDEAAPVTVLHKIFGREPTPIASVKSLGYQRNGFFGRQTIDYTLLSNSSRYDATSLVPLLTC